MNILYCPKCGRTSRKRTTCKVCNTPLRPGQIVDVEAPRGEPPVPSQGRPVDLAVASVKVLLNNPEVQEIVAEGLVGAFRKLAGRGKLTL